MVVYVVFMVDLMSLLVVHNVFVGGDIPIDNLMDVGDLIVGSCKGYYYD